MAKILVLTTDLPFFPGKNGHDFFNARYLATRHYVGVVAPRYPHCPAAGVENLERAVQATFFWPEPAPPTPLFIRRSRSEVLARWVMRLPGFVRRSLLKRLLGIHRDPEDAHEKLAMLANCAPQLLHALESGHWDAWLVIQSSLRPWLDFLPRGGAKIVYFHDVRADYLSRAKPPPPPETLRRIDNQEHAACEQADAVAFVSDDDLRKAKRRYPLPTTAGVASIPVDTGYFQPARSPRGSKTVLFTGHLSHPPNVDAIEYFADQIWPRIIAACPDAKWVVAGLLPAPRVVQAVSRITRAELHANVPDIRPFFHAAGVYVVPMRFGGGVRQKIFEAWSMRLPVVATVMGAEGTNAETGKHCWLEDEPAGFAARVVALLNEPSAEAMLDAAEEKVQREHSIPVAGAQLETICTQAIAARRGRPFRLLFDLRWMEIGRSGGTEQMTHELLSAVGRIDHRNHYTAFVPRSTYHEWEFDPRFKIRPLFSDDSVTRREETSAQIANRLAELEGLPAVLTPEMRTLRAYKNLDFDLVHSTCGYVHPDLARFPQVLTIHDLQHLTYPEFFGRDEWNERERLYKQSVERAVHVVAISEFTRQDVHRRYGIPLEKITTIWNIPSRHVWTALEPGRQQRVLAQLQLTGPFLLFPAHCWPHKNHLRLLQAFQAVLSELPPGLKLVFTGRPFPKDHPACGLFDEVARTGQVVHLGYRSPLEMKALFQGCELLVFPSLFEGFGMPVAEAIIAGKPVLCSNTTSLPEIAGEAALTFDPENVESIGRTLLECVGSPDIPKHLQQAALRRRGLFSARLSAVKTVSLYQRVYDCVYG